MYHYAANNPVRYVDPDGREFCDGILKIINGVGKALGGAAISIIGLAMNACLAYDDVTVIGSLDNFLMPIGFGVSSFGSKIAFDGFRNITSGFYEAISDSIDSKSKSKKNEPQTFIYRTGSGNGTNLTPRIGKDDYGLSYSLIRPEKGPYTYTTIEMINKTGVLIAVRDGDNHVSVRPLNMITMRNWQNSRENANSKPHFYTLILRSISLKVGN